MSSFRVLSPAGTASPQGRSASSLAPQPGAPTHAMPAYAMPAHAMPAHAISHPGPSSPLRRHAALSDVGRVRPHNEDRWHADDLSGLYVVADGMGGYNAGEVAADLAVCSVRRMTPEFLGGDCGPATALQRSIADGNAAIRSFAAGHPDCLGMGTTIVACLLGRDRIHVAHIGDSRAYRLRDGALQRLTRDHSIGQELADAGTLSEARVRLLPARGILTRALGVEATVECDVASIDWLPSDTLLLCSDGLSDPLTDGCIRQLLIDHAGQGPVAQVDALISAALAAGGADNITALIVRAADGVLCSEPMH